MKTIVLCTILLLNAVGAVSQERLEPRGSFAINFEHARFHYSDSSKYVEMYFACFPPLVTLARGENDYKGYVELRLEVQDKLTGEYLIRNRSLLTVAVKDTSDQSYRNTLVTQMGYVFPAGEYAMHVTGIDSLDHDRRDSLSLNVTISPEGGSLTTSDLELCSRIQRSNEHNSMFYKNSHEVIPNPTLVFGAANHPVVFHYLELYNLSEEDTYIVKTIVAEVTGKPLSEKSKRRKYGVKNAVEVGTTNVVNLASGKYLFQVYILSESSEPLTKVEKTFYVYNPNAEQPVADNARMRETELSGLTAEELNQEFSYLRYHTTEPEIRLYEKITSTEGKREFLGHFWDIVERGKMGRDPITRQEYLLRVKRANERFRAFNREGWQTDRGRVFILYGEPDELERKPNSELSKPYEIWHYYQIENGVEFVFVDRTGFGEYILIHSTKRGELRDDDWQRLLQ